MQHRVPVWIPTGRQASRLWRSETQIGQQFLAEPYSDKAGFLAPHGAAAPSHCQDGWV